MEFRMRVYDCGGTEIDRSHGSYVRECYGVMLIGVIKEYKDKWRRERDLSFEVDVRPLASEAEWKRGRIPVEIIRDYI